MNMNHPFGTIPVISIFPPEQQKVQVPTCEPLPIIKWKKEHCITLDQWERFCKAEMGD
jgi:hypothetical protein